MPNEARYLCVHAHVDLSAPPRRPRPRPRPRRPRPRDLVVLILVLLVHVLVLLNRLNLVPGTIF